jgi:hypothetical protein
MLQGSDLASSTPYVLVGRGGSGTRLLAEMAVSSGLFLGGELNVSFDSAEWIDLIYALALKTLAGETGGEARHRDEIRQWAADVLSRAGRSPDDLWGWKLPETIFILPAVLDAFPAARIVHLVRHPVSSALRRTHMTSRMDNPIGAAALPAAYRACARDPDEIERDPVHVHNACSWLFQVRSAIDFIDKSLASGRSLTLRYEDVCAGPAEPRQRLSEFLGRGGPTADPPAIDAERFEEYDPADPRARLVWSICEPLAVRLGYRLERPASITQTPWSSTA